MVANLKENIVTNKLNNDRNINQLGDILKGVLDIGSNSVRLVVFSGNKRVPEPIFNEKVLCGLGRDLGETGLLGNAAMKMARVSLKRFRLVADTLGVTDITVLATSAVRDAKNGREFVAKVEAETGFTVQVISGNEEAELAAQGVFCGAPAAKGLVGDLGGGSLELVRISRRRVHERVSLPIGPLMLDSMFGKDYSAARAYVATEFNKIDWLDKCARSEMYMVGGAWRNISRLLLREKQEPLQILHGYRIQRKDMQRYLKVLSVLRPRDIPYAANIPSRRRNVLPLAGIILDELIKKLKFSSLVVSSYGVREGVLYRSLTERQQKEDPFIFSCRALAEERSRFPEHADKLYAWTRPLLAGMPGSYSKSEERLHLAACYLSDIAWRAHPDFRSSYAVEQALHGHFVGVGHKGRSFVGLVLNQAYGAEIESSPIRHSLYQLEADEVQRARVLGSGLRLAQRISAGTLSLLEECELSYDGKMVSLQASERFTNLMGDVVAKRLKELARLVGAKNRVLSNGQ